MYINIVVYEKKKIKPEVYDIIYNGALEQGGQIKCEQGMYLLNLSEFCI